MAGPVKHISAWRQLLRDISKSEQDCVPYTFIVRNTMDFSLEQRTSVLKTLLLAKYLTEDAFGYYLTEDGRKVL